MADISPSKLIAPHSPKSGLNVLVGAYACEPYRGSEPGVGWNMVQQIARSHRVWVVTDTQHETPITLETQRSPNPNITFVFVGIPWWPRCINKGGNDIRLADFLYYYIWQFYAWRAAIAVLKTTHIDLCHHITFVNDWIFSFLALVPRPFVWGPIGTHPPLPRALSPKIAPFLVDKIKSIVKATLRLCDPLFWLTAIRATLVVGISERVLRHPPLRWLCKGRFVPVPAIAVEDLLTLRPRSVRNGHTLSVLSIGRLVPIKGFSLGLHAFSYLLNHFKDCRLHIVGDGPELEALVSLAKQLKIEQAVSFTGWLPRSDIISLMLSADIFLFPSCEGGGMVVLEAMACGLPVVCLDYGGPSQVVTPESGIRVPLSMRTQTADQLGLALLSLAEQPEQRQTMGNHARTIASQKHSWQARFAFINSLYTRTAA